MNLVPDLKTSEGTNALTGGRTVSIWQDSDEILLTEVEARQLYEWLGRALADKPSCEPQP